MDIQVLIRKLVSYGVQTGLVPEEDVIYTTNRLLELFELDELEDRDNVTMREDELEEVLKGMLDYAYEKRYSQGEQRGIPRSVRYEDHGTADAQTQ